MRVLIVEDEVRLAETLRDLLELERYTADICHDGESGLDNALSDIYDLVILDVMLPKKDGFSVLRALRQQSFLPPHGCRQVLRCRWRIRRGRCVQAVAGGLHRSAKRTVRLRWQSARPDGTAAVRTGPGRTVGLPLS